MSEQTSPPPEPAPTPVKDRQPNAIYQGNRIVARVLDPEVDLEAKEIRFGQVYRSDELLLPEECEFQKYRIMIQRVAFATKIDKTDPTRGRVLTGVTADLLGYREQ